MIQLFKKLHIDSTGNGYCKLEGLGECVKRIHVTHMVSGSWGTLTVNCESIYAVGSDAIIHFQSYASSSSDFEIELFATITILDADLEMVGLSNNEKEATIVGLYDCNCDCGKAEKSTAIAQK